MNALVAKFHAIMESSGSSGSCQIHQQFSSTRHRTQVGSFPNSIQFLLPILTDSYNQFSPYSIIMAFNMLNLLLQLYKFPRPTNKTLDTFFCNKLLLANCVVHKPNLQCHFISSSANPLFLPLSSIMFTTPRCQHNKCFHHCNTAAKADKALMNGLPKERQRGRRGSWHDSYKAKKWGSRHFTTIIFDL